MDEETVLEEPSCFDGASLSSLDKGARLEGVSAMEEDAALEELSSLVKGAKLEAVSTLGEDTPLELSFDAAKTSLEDTLSDKEVLLHPQLLTATSSAIIAIPVLFQNRFMGIPSCPPV